MISVTVPADDSDSHGNTRTRTPGNAALPSTSGRKSAHQFAAEHQQEVAILHDLINKKGLQNLPARLRNSDAEVIRYRIDEHAESSSSALDLYVYVCNVDYCADMLLQQAYFVQTRSKKGSCCALS